VRWRFFLYGALVFTLSQLITRIPLVQVAQYFLTPALQASQVLLYGWLVVLAITAGLFEEVGRYLGYKFLVKDNKTWQVGLMYGAGHGGLESMLLIGGLAILSLVGIVAMAQMDLSAMSLPPEQVAQIEVARQQIAALDWWTPLLGAYERFITIFFHIALSILVLQTFLRGSLLWLGAAILYHAAIDLVAVFVVQQVSPAMVEVILTVSLPINLAIIYYFRPRATPVEALLPA
jgi:uncharacterized membrane protein YhfC